MAILKVTGLGVSFGTRSLFSDVQFELQPGEKVGLIGANGTGKTTLLRIILGLDKPDAGMAHFSDSVRIACVEQNTDPRTLQCQTLYQYTERAFASIIETEKQIAAVEQRLTQNHGAAEALRLSERLASLYFCYNGGGGQTFRARTRAALLGLGFSDEEQARPLSTFSGGQAGKAKLARAILTEADLLLLDEPTNHLDLSAVLWLESYLSDYKGAVLLVSHDRRFLDKVTTRTLELENGRLLSGIGAYSRYIELKQGKQAAREKLYKSQLKEIKRIEGIIAQQRRWNQERNYVTIASKQKEIDRIRERLDPPPRDPAAVHFSFKARDIVSRDALTVNALSFAFDKSKPLFGNAGFRVGTGELVCLVGPNGCGKTTVLKLLAGRLALQGGNFRFADGVQVGYYAQTTENMNGANTVLAELQNGFPRMDNTELRAALALFLFRGDDIYKNVGVLSGGERARIQLLKLMLSSANFLLLDEPTNHLDLASAEALENAVENYTGTCLLVTHDRYLIERLADRVLFLAQDGIRELEFPFEEAYSAACNGNTNPRVALSTETPHNAGSSDARAALSAKTPHIATASDNLRPESKNHYQAQKQHKLALSRARQAVRAAENAILTNEAQICDTERQLAAATAAGAYEELETLYVLLNALQSENRELYGDLDRAESAFAEANDKISGTSVDTAD